MAVRVLQVGMGGWGRDWASAVVPEVEEIEAVGYVDTDPASLTLAREELGAQEEQCFPNLDAGIEATDPEAVLVTASLPGHAPAVLGALEAGKHVLVEKPFAQTVDEGRTLVEAAAARDLVLMVSQNYRFFPAVQAVIKLVREEALGPVGAVGLEFRRWANVGPGGRRRPHHALRHPLLVDMAIHHFDLMRAVLGEEPREIFCRAWNPPWSNFDGPASGTAVITFDGGTVADYRGSWVSPGPMTAWAGEWRVECAEGEISWTSRLGGGNRAGGDWVEVRPLGEKSHRIELPELRYVGRAGSLAALAEAIRTGQEPESSGRDNLNSLALMNAAVESAATGSPVTLSPPDSA